MTSRTSSYTLTPWPRHLLAACSLWMATAAHADTPSALPSVDQAVTNIVSSNTGIGHPSSGIDINAFMGADRFYNAGYSGTRAIQAVIDAEHIWNGHQTLTHVQTFVTGTGALGSVGAHATEVGQAMGGNPLSDIAKSGIAPDAQLWSGAIATSVTGNSFDVTNASLASTFSTILKTGVNGKTADVSNSSWGFTEPTGHNQQTAGIDGLLYQTGKIGVVSAGNGDSSSNTVTSPAAGYNAIAVAALGSDTDANPYNQVSSFSSRGPNDYFDPNTGNTIAGVRARVDIAAPGQNLTLATTGSANAFVSNVAGTSFSAPIVAGGASLVVDAGKAVFASDANAIDGRVVKAVLLNGADKTQGWDNGQHLASGVMTTTQSLDYAAGSGRMDLNHTFDQYVDTSHGGMAGTTDVIGKDCATGGLCNLGNVANVGWDYGKANLAGTNQYFISGMLAANHNFTATLDWYADIDPGSNTDFSGAQYNHLANLDLMIFEYDPLTRLINKIVAQSTSTYNLVEHLSFLLPDNAYYGMEVVYAGDLWNFNNSSGEYYGLAWSGSAFVPEPDSIFLMLAGFGAFSLVQPRARPRESC